MIALAVALATPVVTQGGHLFPGSGNSTPSATDRVAGAAAESPPLDTRELVVNGGFEDGVSGWRVNDSRTQQLISDPGGRSGVGSATVAAITAGNVVLNDAANTVTSTVAGTTFQVTAYVKGSKPGLSAMVRVREVRSEELVDSGGSLVQLTTDWQQVSFTHITRSTGGQLDLNVVGWKLPAGTSVTVDDVSLRRVTQAPTPSPSSGSPSPGSPSNGTACVDRRGIPDCGTFLGAAIGSNADPAPKEASFGSRLGLHRTYFKANQVPGAVRMARSDLAAGRLPWISFKLPYSWTEMADGKGDAWARDLATQLSQVGGPVWLALHHEPENDGTMSEWVRMQAHLSPIIRNTAPNVAYTIVLTGWNQVFGTNPAFSFEATWPGDGLVDIVGIDPYNEYGAVKNGKMITKSVELKEYYAPLAAFAARHRTHWAVAETGYTDLQASRDPAWLNRAYADMEAMGGVGLAYFDSHLNSIANWQLTTPDKISAFGSALRSSNSTRLAP